MKRLIQNLRLIHFSKRIRLQFGTKPERILITCHYFALIYITFSEFCQKA
jgi:hypothetical protein